MEEFNFPDIDWRIHAANSRAQILLDVMGDRFLHQTVKEQMRSDAILDVALVNSKEELKINPD